MKRVFLILLIFFTAGSTPLWSASENYPIVSTVYEQQRSTKGDIILFRNKNALRGQVLNENISIATQYGMFSIPVQKCAGISFEKANTNNESVVTVNFNSFTGIITDNTIKFKIGSSGKVISVRKEKIRYILFKKDANESELQSKHTKSDLFVMSNGDLISGESIDRKITVETDYGRISLNFSDIEKIETKGEDNVVAIITRTNGEAVQGFMDTNEISIDLELGIKIESIYKDRFTRIFVDQARKQAPAQNNLASSEGAGYDSAIFPVTGEPLEQTININLEPLVGQKGIRMTLALIPAGEFVMGSGAAEKGRKDNEGPVRKVFISKPFYMGIYEVTQEQYNAVMGNNPAKFNGPDNPVEQVTWKQAMFFCEKISKITKMKFSLPTEAQWEYAARAGSQTRFYFGDDDSELDTCAWYKKNSKKKSHPVGRKKPNKFGLYDMHGNVFEWCMDWYQGNYINLATKDPGGPKQGSNHVIRGGAWHNDSKICRSANRSYGSYDYYDSGIGFRVILLPPDQ